MALLTAVFDHPSLQGTKGSKGEDGEKGMKGEDGQEGEKVRSELHVLAMHTYLVPVYRASKGCSLILGGWKIQV